MSPDDVNTDDGDVLEDAAPEPALTKELASVGFGALPVDATPAERQALRRALKAHSSGRYEESRGAFEEISQQNPDLLIAQFNLACAMAKLNELDGAESILERLLSRDLPDYRRRLRQDEDLAALREGSRWARLEAKIAQIEQTWREGVKRGLPVVFEGERPRAAAWLPEQRRLIPVGPRESNVVATLTDLELEKVLIITKRRGRDEYDYVLQLSVHPLFGESDGFQAEIADSPLQVAFEPTKEGARYRSTKEGMSYLRNMPWQALRSTGSERASNQLPTTRHFLRGETSIISLHPPRFAAKANATNLVIDGVIFHGNTLKVSGRSERVQLSRGHGVCVYHSFIKSSDGRTAFAFSNRLPLKGRGCRHVIDRIDLESWEVSPVSSGPGVGFVRFGDDGNVYVQIGSVTKRLETPSASLESAVPLIDGVVLSPSPCR